MLPAAATTEPQTDTSPGACAVSAVRRGITYLDMLVTVMVLGVLAATAVPRYADALARHQAQAAAARVAAEVEYARQLAIARSTSVTVQLSASDHTCVINNATSLDRPSETHSVALSAPPYYARVVANGTNSLWQFTFNLHGVPDHGGTIALTSGTAQSTVTINASTGRASVP